MVREAGPGPTVSRPEDRGTGRGDPAGGRGPAPRAEAAAPVEPADLLDAADLGSNPWSTWGWVIQSIWLVFLAFPLLALLGEPAPAWQLALGVLAIVCFAVAYAAGCRHLDRLEKACRPMHRAGAAWLLGLAALALVTVPLIGVGATSFLPFLVAFAMFGLPLRWAIAAVGAGVAASVLSAIFLDTDEGGWVIAFIVLSIGVMTGGIRVMSGRAAQYEALQRELGLVEERERVARDVHDVLGHSLTVVTVKAELAERLIDLDPERARAELADIRELSRQALAEIRETVGGLRGASLAVELAAARRALSGAGIRGEVPEDADEVDPRHRTVLAWVLREAATNVVRHSQAATCVVDLGPNLLRVTDDGRGVDGNPPGNGLRGVRERVERAGGHLSVGPRQDGVGTVLEVTL